MGDSHAIATPSVDESRAHDPHHHRPSTAQSAVRRVDRAVILAAGAGCRLKPFTNENPKCLVEVRGTPVLENALNHLSVLGVKKVTIVVGHHRDIIVERFGWKFLGMSITYVISEKFESTNNIYSLWLARSHLTEDVLLLEADVFFERAVLERLISGAGNLAVVSKHQKWMSGTVVNLDADEQVQTFFDIGLQDESFDYDRVYKTANLYLLRRDYLRSHFVPLLEARVKSGDVNSYYESILSTLTRRGEDSIGAVVCDDLKWYEIDDRKDLCAAEYLFSSPAQRYGHVSEQHGGYWRFGFVDHAYLYNAYYPPKGIFDYFERNLRDLVLNYPAGQDEVARSVSVLIDHPAAQIVVGNGASELIKIISGRVAKRVICPVPSFNEYENAMTAGVFIPFELRPPAFELDVEAFARRAAACQAEVAVVVTPNNPTGLSVPRADLLRLADLLRPHDCMLVVDESFIDFARAPSELSVEAWVEGVTNLAVIKSLSKSFGIGGLRLGYLLTANTKFAELVRSELHIWNINSFAETFLLLAPRYRRAFKASCARVRSDCDRLHAQLAEIDGVRAYPSDANFVMCRLPNEGPSAPEVAKSMFVEFNILVKHCGGKPMPDGDRYLRVASRTAVENGHFVEALRRCLDAG